MGVEEGWGGGVAKVFVVELDSADDDVGHSAV
jgi:hypothetical protein